MEQSVNGDTAPMAEPPEGALRGENVPTENDADDFEEAAIQEMVALLKTHPAYHGRVDSELREIANEKLQEAT
jgi:hypothetical protein